MKAPVSRLSKPKFPTCTEYQVLIKKFFDVKNSTGGGGGGGAKGRRPIKFLLTTKRERERKKEKQKKARRRRSPRKFDANLTGHPAHIYNKNELHQAHKHYRRWYKRRQDMGYLTLG